jgi:microsomal dipeptidase-like Zn-dependent dipeptidase
MIDVSHLNEAGFWDVARASNAPLVATHSNAHRLCASSRNLTDEQLDAVGASNGVVGINFANAFLRQDGRPDADAPLELIVAHVAHVARRIGVEHVALGSDFEGATIPDALGGVAGLPRLVDALRQHGFGEDDVAAVHAPELAARARADVVAVAAPPDLGLSTSRGRRSSTRSRASTWAGLRSTSAAAPAFAVARLAEVSPSILSA